MGGEQDVVLGHILGNGRRSVLVGKALRSALEKIKISPVVGELNVNRGTERLFEDSEDVADVLNEGGRPTSPPRSATRSSLSVSTSNATGLRRTSSLSTEKTFSNAGYSVPCVFEQLLHLDGFECVGLEIDDVHGLR